MTDHAKYMRQKRMADNQKQQTCGGNTYHMRAASQGSAIQRQRADILEV